MTGHSSNARRFVTSVPPGFEEIETAGSNLIRLILENLGEEAAVLWDAAGIELDPGFRTEWDPPDMELLRHRLDRNFKDVRCECVVLQYRGRFIAAWTGAAWIRRRDPFAVDGTSTLGEFNLTILAAFGI